MFEYLHIEDIYKQPTLIQPWGDLKNIETF